MSRIRRTSTRPEPRRRISRAAAAGLVSALAILGGAGMIAASSPAGATTGQCPPGYLPAPNGQGAVEHFTDNNVSVFAGENFTTDAFVHESEGLLLVEGDMKTNGQLQVGWVGVGSQTNPSQGSVMLAVGGDLVANGALHVGADTTGGSGLGGDVNVGGTATAPTKYLYGGTLTDHMGAAATQPWAAFPGEVAGASASFAAMSATGTVFLDSGYSESDVGLILTGDGTTGTQVFTVTAAQLNSAHGVVYKNIAGNAPVIVDVVGGPVSLGGTYFSVQNDGVVAGNPTFPFGAVAQRTLWNFADAAQITLHNSDAWLGSVLAPKANLDTWMQMNGRVYVGRTITMNGPGEEFHNYPWIGTTSQQSFSCVPIPISPVTPPADDDPVTPPADDDPVTPPADDDPVTPPADDDPVTPPADDDPVTPPADQPVAPTTDDASDVPAGNDDAATPVVEDDAAAIAVQDDAAAEQVDHAARSVEQPRALSGPHVATGGGLVQSVASRTDVLAGSAALAMLAGVGAIVFGLRRKSDRS